MMKTLKKKLKVLMSLSKMLSNPKNKLVTRSLYQKLLKTQIKIRKMKIKKNILKVKTFLNSRLLKKML